MENNRSLSNPQESAGSDPRTKPQPYFTVGAVKFSLMSATTFGLYELYWLYKNWQVIRDHEQSRISPFWRTFFAPLWTFAMGRHFTAEANAQHVSLTLSVVPLGVLYLVLSALWAVPDPYALISLFAFVPLLPFDRAARLLDGNGQLAEPTHGRYSRLNIAWLIVGSLLLVLVIIGSFMSESLEQQII